MYLDLQLCISSGNVCLFCIDKSSRLRGGIEDNSNIIFLISQYKHML